MAKQKYLVLVRGCSCSAGPSVGEKVSHVTHCPVLLSTSKHLVKSVLTKREWQEPSQLCLGSGVGALCVWTCALCTCGAVSGALPWASSLFAFSYRSCRTHSLETDFCFISKNFLTVFTENISRDTFKNQPSFLVCFQSYPSHNTCPLLNLGFSCKIHKWFM